MTGTTRTTKPGPEFAYQERKSRMVLRDMTEQQLATDREWLAFVEEADGGSIFHTDAYVPMLTLCGWHPQLLVVRRSERIVAGCLLAVKPILRTGLSIAEVRNGILLADGAEEADLRNLLDRVREISRRAGSIFVKLGANVVLSREGVPDERGLRVQEALRQYGCRIQDKPESSTFWIDLRRSDDELLAGMNASGRRKVRAAQKAGIEVVEKSTPADLVKLYEMHTELYKSKGITVTPEIVFFQGVRQMAERGQVTVFWAMRGDTPLSCAVISLIGTPRFLWGGRDLSPREEGNVPSGQMLHFGIMQALRQRGKRIYDLGGSPAAQLDPSHPNYGVWLFKRGLGGVHVDFVDGYRLVSSRFFSRVHDSVYPLYRRVFPVSPFLRRRRGTEDD